MRAAVRFVGVGVLLVLGGACAPKGVVLTVGPDGGELTTDDGVVVTIPPGALSEDLEISVVERTEEDLAEAPEGSTWKGGHYAFLPHGTVFSQPVQIELPAESGANGVLRLDDEEDTSWEEVAGVTVSDSRARFQTLTFSVMAAAETVALECPSPAAGRTGTGTLEGGGFTPVDVVALLNHYTNRATDGGQNVRPYRTELRIRFSDFLNSCGLEEEGLLPDDGTAYQLYFTAESETAFPPVPPVGTYPLDANYPAPLDTAFFRGGGGIWDCAGEGTCSYCGNAFMEHSGSVIITNSSSLLVEGSFQYTQDGTSYSGTFSAPVCTAGVEDMDYEDYCCYVESGAPM